MSSNLIIRNWDSWNKTLLGRFSFMLQTFEVDYAKFGIVLAKVISPLSSWVELACDNNLFPLPRQEGREGMNEDSNSINLQ